MKKKIFIDINPLVNIGKLCSIYERTDDPFDADWVIYFSTYRYNVDPKKCVMVQVEPPLADHRIMLYGATNTFHTVYTFNPNPYAKNEFLVTSKPSVFPYFPKNSLWQTREDTTITNRGVYFAGGRSALFENQRDLFGSMNLYKIRSEIVEFLLKNHEHTHAFGTGWPTQTKNNDVEVTYDGHWRDRKIKEIKEIGADFVLCVENSCLDNYLTEKLHDGIASDRVVLYLGSKCAADYVDPRAFVDLYPMLEVAPFTTISGELKKHFNYIALLNLITKMSQAQYDEIIGYARAWREDHARDEDHYKEIDRLTDHIIGRLRDA